MGALVDAVRLLRHRRHFPELEEALHIIGLTLRSDAPTSHSVDSANQGDSWLEGEDDDSWFEKGATPGEDAINAGQYSNLMLAEVLREQRRSDTGARGTGGPSPLMLAGDEKVICSVLDPVEVPPVQRSPYTSIPLPSFRGEQRTLPAIEPTTLSAALYSLTKAPRKTSQPDLDAVMARLVQGLPLDNLPPERIPAAPSTLLVLVDQSLRVGPCAHDVDQILDALRSTLGRSIVTVWGFVDDADTTCGSGPTWAWRPLREHQVSTPVMFVSGGDLGRAPTGTPYIDRASRQLVARGVAVSALLLAPTPAHTRQDYPCWIVDD